MEKDRAESELSQIKFREEVIKRQKDALTAREERIDKDITHSVAEHSQMAQRILDSKNFIKEVADEVRAAAKLERAEREESNGKIWKELMKRQSDHDERERSTGTL